MTAPVEASATAADSAIQNSSHLGSRRESEGCGTSTCVARHSWLIGQRSYLWRDNKSAIACLEFASFRKRSRNAWGRTAGSLLKSLQDSASCGHGAFPYIAPASRVLQVLHAKN